MPQGVDHRHLRVVRSLVELQSICGWAHTPHCGITCKMIWRLQALQKLQGRQRPGTATQLSQALLCTPAVGQFCSQAPLYSLDIDLGSGLEEYTRAVHRPLVGADARLSHQAGWPRSFS